MWDYQSCYKFKKQLLNDTKLVWDVRIIEFWDQTC
jgi:hypothetical protein